MSHTHKPALSKTFAGPTLPLRAGAVRAILRHDARERTFQSGCPNRAGREKAAAEQGERKRLPGERKRLPESSRANRDRTRHSLRQGEARTNSARCLPHMARSSPTRQNTRTTHTSRSHRVVKRALQLRAISRGSNHVRASYTLFASSFTPATVATGLTVAFTGFAAALASGGR